MVGVVAIVHHVIAGARVLVDPPAGEERADLAPAAGPGPDSGGER